MCSRLMRETDQECRVGDHAPTLRKTARQALQCASPGAVMAGNVAPMFGARQVSTSLPRPRAFQGSGRHPYAATACGQEGTRVEDRVLGDVTTPQGAHGARHLRAHPDR